MLLAIACKKENTNPAARTSAGDANNSVQSFTIGQEYQGGIIVWIDETGEHGLIAAKTDQSLGATWNNIAFGVTGATGKNIGAGPYNTRKIVRFQGTDGIYAALLCAQYRNEGYNDWYLPSKNELAEMYKQKALIGAGDHIYWSSTEVDENIAWAQNFATGGRKQNLKDKIYYVRAARTF